MKLWQEIFTQINGENVDGNVLDGNYIVCINRGGYFQNVKRILAFSSVEVVLSLRKGQLKITGNNLMVAKYCEGDVFLRGHIDGVTLEGVPKSVRAEV